MTSDRSDGLAPSLLLSMPQLTDPNFSQTVVLLCEHTAEGAWGLVLNRPTGKTAASAVQLVPPTEHDSGLELWVGGPVEPQRGCLLLSTPPTGDDAVRIADGLYISVSIDVLRRLIDGPKVPRARLLMGYAGWGPGQLDDEITASAWLFTDIALELVFETAPNMMWETAIRRLGADPANLQASGGVH
jgi:putative transcriptional regulator